MAVASDGDATDRERRAAEEAMAVVPVASGLARVYRVEDDYLVDLREPACECRDWQYRSDEIQRCKHIARVLMTVSLLDIPSGVDPDPVLEKQREQLGGDPRSRRNK